MDEVEKEMSSCKKGTSSPKGTLSFDIFHLLFSDKIHPNDTYRINM